jgi:phosphatidylserine/phosphatidylglycerophosphate/cardiolipin synthase-like enzyme
MRPLRCRGVWCWSSVSSCHRRLAGSGSGYLTAAVAARVPRRPGGPEPAAAFGSVAGIELWYWPVTQRTESGSKLHAKLAVADRRVLLVSSANLTQSGVGKNIEAGLLVRGGSAPQRAAEHIAELQSRGVLARLQAHHAGRLS